MNVDWRGGFYIIVYYIIIIMFLSASMVRDQVIFPSIFSEILFLLFIFCGEASVSSYGASVHVGARWAH